jgi:cysteine-rich repeat protein
MEGTLVLAGSARKQRFRATLSECGDGRLDTAHGETCDGAESCPPGYYCDDDCACSREDETPPPPPPTTTSTFPTTTTIPREICGDGVIQGQEVCDGAALGGRHCPRGGPLTCFPSCLGIDWSGCYRCGNGIREGSEACDCGNGQCDLGDANCPAESTGEPACTASCRLNYRPCRRCGDGDIDGTEWCDDGNTLDGDGCSATCQSECGNGIIQRNEECDDGNRSNDDGCDDFCFAEQVYYGGGGEAFDRCPAQWHVELPSSSPLGSMVSCRDGIGPCDRDLSGDGQCRFLVSFCLNDAAWISGVCGPTDVARVELEGASLSGVTALDAIQQAAVLDAFATALGGWGGAVVSGAGVVREASPPVAIVVCGQFLLDVPVGMQRAVAVAVTDSRMPPTIDHDQLTFECLP